jgi:acetyl esterase
MSSVATKMVSCSSIVAVVVLALAVQWLRSHSRWEDVAVNVFAKAVSGIAATPADDTDAILAAIANMQRLQEAFVAEANVADVAITEFNVTVRDGASLRVRRYSPRGQSSTGAVVYYHGGGWVLGGGRVGLIAQDEHVVGMVRHLQADVFSVDYRCAPVHRFPVAAYDSIDAFCAIVAQAAVLGFDAGKVGVAGISAGANLAVVTALSFDSLYAGSWQNARLCAGVRAPHAVLSSVGVLDATFSSVSSVREHRVGALSLHFMTWFRNVYAPESRTVVDPLLSPLLADAGALKRLPRTLVVTGTHDILMDDSLRFAAALGDKATLVALANTPHEFQLLPFLYTQEKSRVFDAQRKLWISL